ncbi:MAG: AAA family ATPase [Candidatus Omnitrophica bacterium]|nr:AAA family ATPase [Candidatus Omnitrophota bacterium]MBU0881457.1 AAA family ATPase [Candidatus Omnitrophota bacterium]MBU0895103.1 AAA family ATPase [Candidatus Omnitrophota bacterium]MBU1809035.1 AAA family ATPase [Candidatus Omnitrophota bacterium]
MYCGAFLSSYRDREISIGTVIAVNGKGGTGKTTIAGLIVSELIRRKKGSILAIDADPNSCFAGSLGVKDPATIVGICEEISGHMDKIPSGVTKDRFIEMKVQESLTETKDFDLLVMGAPEGPGCYCYVNNLLREIIGRITRGYDYTVIDNAAGMEHISRRTSGDISKLLVVSDYSIPGVRAAKKIYKLAKTLKTRIGGAYLILNRVSGSLSLLKDEISATGMDMAGEVPYSAKLVEWNISDKPIFALCDKAVTAAITGIFDKFTENLQCP